MPQVEYVAKFGCGTAQKYSNRGNRKRPSRADNTPLTRSGDLSDPSAHSSHRGAADARPARGAVPQLMDGAPLAWLGH